MHVIKTVDLGCTHCTHGNVVCGDFDEFAEEQEDHLTLSGFEVNHAPERKHYCVCMNIGMKWVHTRQLQNCYFVP